MLALFSQFLTPGSPAGVKAVMVATVGAIDGLWYCCVALLLGSGRAQGLLLRRAAQVNRAFGALLLALAAWVAVRTLV
jgi:threonine/homoserine/homoserine lactone efflux protein